MTTNDINRKLIKATETIAKEYGIKFCTSCNLTRPVEGGKTVPVANGRTRWKCATCAAKLKPTGFKNRKGL
jgi:hypothetical protein